MQSALLTLLLFGTVVTQGFAKVAAISFEQLAQDSDVIVIAKVESTSRSPDGQQYAKAIVTEVWKGTPLKQIEFRATPTWACDTSAATTGETVLLFLKKGGQPRAYAIAHSGRGRMPLQTVNGKVSASVSPDVQLPKNTSTTNGSVEIATLRDLVKKVMEKKEQSR